MAVRMISLRHRNMCALVLDFAPFPRSVEEAGLFTGLGPSVVTKQVCGPLWKCSLEKTHWKGEKS